jgi:hypothetical protein
MRSLGKPKTIKPEILARPSQTATADGATYSQVLLDLLERVEALEQRPIPGFVELAAPTPEAAPVATENGLLRCYGQAIEDAVKREASHDEAKDAGRRACYDLGRQHGAAQPTPPAALSDALIKAECALSDIAEGEETNAAPNTFEWAEQRCAKALDTIRPVMRDQGIRTSEWPPVSQHPPAAEAAADRVLVNCPETCWVEIRRVADGKLIYSNHRKGTLVIPVGEPPAAPPWRAGGLVDQVAKAIHPSICADPNLYRHEARAAIREVAAWLDQRGMHGCSLWLREEADR